MQMNDLLRNVFIFSCLVSVTQTASADCEAAIDQDLYFGRYINEQASAKKATVPALLEINCTGFISVLVTIGMDFGQQPLSTSTPDTRRMENGGSLLNYQVYVPTLLPTNAPGQASVWGLTNGSGEMTSSTLVFPNVPSIVRIENAYVFGNQNVEPNDGYRDTLTLVINF